MSFNYNDGDENLKDLEDDDVSIKKKTKKTHNFKGDEFFYKIKTTYNQLSAIFSSPNNTLQKGNFVIIPTPYGNEMGICQGLTTNMDEISYQDDILEIVRIANDKDKAKYSENIKKESKAFTIAIEKIKQHRLEMKLINVHYFLEDNKILFNFTSDGRVDFRELVKDLATVFKTRIELRQIGVRDECRILGSYGQCGKQLCCSEVLSELSPITIKMAKEQNITLNSLKLSGTCGRLLCCLAYEYETYIQEKKDYPKEGSKIKVGGNVYSVVEINVQTKKVKVLNDENKSEMLYIAKNDIRWDKTINMLKGIIREENT